MPRDFWYYTSIRIWLFTKAAYQGLFIPSINYPFPDIFILFTTDNGCTCLKTSMLPNFVSKSMKVLFMSELCRLRYTKYGAAIVIADKKKAISESFILASELIATNWSSPIVISASDFEELFKKPAKVSFRSTFKWIDNGEASTKTNYLLGHPNHWTVSRWSERYS